jgi:hypothetical protein
MARLAKDENAATWFGENEEEVQLLAMPKGQVTKKAGFSKIDRCREQAQLDRIEWVWVDTCCIDKTSSTELLEAINSM